MNRASSCVAAFCLLAVMACPVAAADAELAKCWLARPAQTEPKILAWAKAYPDLVSLDALQTRGGHTAYAVTVTNRKLDNASKRKMLVAQPHAHEPAATVGMMDFLAQLLEGKDLAGRSTSLDRQKILDRMLLSFIPDGNPDGRARAPVDWWDGAKYSNKEFLNFAFGRESDGRMAQRVGRWSERQHVPELIGFVYEKINDHEYVEPNRDTESSYFRLIRQLRERDSYSLILDLHQTEFERSDRNCMIILPFMQKQLPEPVRDRNQRWGQAVVEAWQKSGARPIKDIKPLGYREDQLQYFRKCWGDIFPKTPYLCVEIQNNNPRTPPREQMQLMVTAIRTSIDAILAEKE